MMMDDEFPDTTDTASPTVIINQQSGNAPQQQERILMAVTQRKVLHHRQPTTAPIEQLFGELAETLAALVEHPHCPDDLIHLVEKFVRAIEAADQPAEHLVRATAFKVRSLVPLYLTGIRHQADLDRDAA